MPKIHLIICLAVALGTIFASHHAQAQSGDSRSGSLVHGTLVQSNREQDRSSRSSRTGGRAAGRERQETQAAAQPEQQEREEAPTQQAAAPQAPAPTNSGTQSQAIHGIPASLTGGAGTPQGSTESAANRRVNVDLLPGHADPNMAVLFLDPPYVSAVEGDSFSTQAVLSNPSAREYQTAVLSVHYNTAAVEPVGYPSTHLTEAAFNFEMAHDPSRGLIQFLLEFEDSRSDIWVPIVDIEWEAHREVRSTAIAFVNDETTPTFVGYSGGRSILGNRTRDVPGVISTRVQVTPNLNSVVQSLEQEGGVTLPWVDTGRAEEVPTGGVTLALQPRQIHAEVGGVLDVDVVIENESFSIADELRFRVLFDTNALEVIDSHEGNWIEQGTNIWDGGYHRSYPFDIHVRNSADNTNGTIDYRMGFTDQVPLAGGTVATIRFRALRPMNAIELDFDPESTFVQRLGEDLLGDPEDPEDGTAAAEVSVVPRAATARRLGGEPIS